MHGVYFAILKRAIIEQPDVLNIALSGTYGTGKSSILRKLREEFNDRVIELSLLTLGVQPDQVGQQEEMNPAARTTTNRIQKEIVKQLLYQQRPSDAPRSRFRRISRTRWKPELVAAAVTAVVAVAVAGLVGLTVATAPVVGVALADRPLPLLVTLLYVGVAVLAAGAVVSFRALVRGRAAIEKLSAGPATITLPPRSASYFDEYLDEIIYFFETNSSRDIVIIEDLDRFDDPQIFEALRSLNGLLNTARQLGNRNIRFIYAVRDSVFGKLGQEPGAVGDEARAELSRANRTKFFEMVVPVVPFITHKNARDLMHELLEKRGHIISKELVHLAARHLADMRLIHNIVNEYEVFRHRLLDVPRPVPELDAERLFAMVLLKNAHMADFENVRLGSSSLDDLWDLWRELVRTNIDGLTEANLAITQRNSDRRAAEEYATELGQRLRTQIDAMALAPGSGLASSDIAHAGAAVSDAALQTASFWRMFLTGNNPLIVQVWRNGQYGSGPMHLSKQAVETLTGMRVDSARFVTTDIASGERAIENNTRDMAFLRRHSWKQLAETPKFVYQRDGGPSRSFRQWAETLLPSKLASDLVVHGFITSYFQLHVSAFYGQLIRPDAMVYVMRAIDHGTADIDYQLDAEDVEAILLDQGTTVLTERSMLNVSIVDHLLGQRTADALTVIKTALGFDEWPAFLQRYLGVGTEKSTMVRLLAPITPSIFAYLAEGAPLDAAERIDLLDVAIQHQARGVTYVGSDRLRLLLSSDFAKLPALSAGDDEYAVNRAVRFIQDNGAVAQEIAGLPASVIRAFAESEAYALTSTNLSAIAGPNFSLDALLAEGDGTYAYATANITHYLTAVADSTTTEYTVETSRTFADTLRDATEWGPSDLEAFIRGAKPDCEIDDLIDFPGLGWPALMSTCRVPATYANVTAYLDTYEVVDQSLAETLAKAVEIDDLDGVDVASRTALAVSILNSPAEQLTPEDRVRLAVSLSPGVLDTNSIHPLAGPLVGDLLRAGLIADDEDAFANRLMLDWDTQAHAMLNSTNFADLISPSTLQPVFVSHLFEDGRFGALLPSMVAALHAYPAGIGAAVAAMAARALNGEVELDGDDIALARRAGLPDATIIELLAMSAVRVTDEQLRRVLVGLGDKWAKVAVRGHGTHKIRNIPGAEAILTRLKEGGIVSSMPLVDTEFRVSPFHPRRG
ncbi:YobI family P-loop NTPase [Microbacterium enclense]|uniref:YobI family P-loop NTPase n=1 Tax=Microbacterium enclense TaxID=993073 RepID=UPI003F80BA0E